MLSSEQHWKRMLTERMDGVRPLLTKPMPQLLDHPKEVYFEGFTIIIPEDQMVANDRLNRLDWWDYVVSEAGFDKRRGLEWVVFKSNRRGHRVQIVWCRKPRQDDSQPAISPVTPAPQESGATTRAEA